MGPSSSVDSSSEQGEESLEVRLGKISHEKLVQEVISVWNEAMKIEQELVISRQRTRALELELEAIELARKYIKQYSYREIANWLTKKTGREISHVGLRKRLMHEQQRKNKARTLRKWSEYAQKAIEKAKAIEESRVGAKA